MWQSLKYTHDVYDALYVLLSDTHGFEWRGALLDVNTTFDEAVGVLSNFDFSILHKPNP